MHFSFLLGLTLCRINHIFSIRIEKEEKQSWEYFNVFRCQRALWYIKHSYSIDVHTDFEYHLDNVVKIQFKKKNFLLAKTSAKRLRFLIFKGQFGGV